jgi:hypothetical protein
MEQINIKREYFPKRCEICHQGDLFNPFDNSCLRCISLFCGKEVKPRTNFRRKTRKLLYGGLIGGASSVFLVVAFLSICLIVGDNLYKTFSVVKWLSSIQSFLRVFVPVIFLPSFVIGSLIGMFLSVFMTKEAILPMIVFTLIFLPLMLAEVVILIYGKFIILFTLALYCLFVLLLNRNVKLCNWVEKSFVKKYC